MLTSSRALALCAAALLMAGCASPAAQKADANAVAESTLLAAKPVCAAKPTWTERTTCQNSAIKAYISQVDPADLDIVALANASRLKVAQMVDAKQMNEADGKIEMAKITVDANNRIQERANAQRALAAQEEAAIPPPPMPVTCSTWNNPWGATTNCY